MSFVAAPTAVGVSTLAAVALLGALGARERRRGRAVWRLLALAVAVVALLALVVRPVLTRRGPAECILSTPGATAELARAVDIAPGRVALRIDHDAGQPIARGARVHLVGHGLHKFEIDALAAEVVSLRAPPLDDGLRSVSWPRGVRVGDRIVVRGAVSLGRGGRVRLVGPGGEEAAADLSPGESAFELGVFARAAGPELRRLVIQDATGAVIDDLAVDVAVAEPSGLNVLWLEAAPSFETRYFKAWLLTTPGTLVVRSAVSRDRVRITTHPAGTPFADLATPGTLERFDVVVSDDATIGKLPAAELRAVVAAVESGLGLLLRGEVSAARPTDLLAPAIDVRASAGVDALEVIPQGLGLAQPATLTIPAREIVAGDRLRSIVRDRSDRLLAAWHDRGAGRIARTVVDGTYRWVLEGNPGAHAEYWRDLLGAIARRRPPGTTLTVAPGPIYVDRPLTVRVATIDPQPDLTIASPGDAGETQALALRQDPTDAQQWDAILRPRAVGWHRLVATPSVAETWFLVSPPPPVARDAAERQAATRAHLALAAPSDSGPGVSAEIARELPRGWPFAVLVVALASLWLDERLGRGHSHGPSSTPVAPHADST